MCDVRRLLSTVCSIQFVLQNAFDTRLVAQGGPLMTLNVHVLVRILLVALLLVPLIDGKGSFLRKFDKSCTNILWLVGFQTKAEDGGEVFYLADNNEYVQYLKVAILSAQRNAPSLIPVIVFTGGRTGNSELTVWIEEHGGYVLNHKLSFYKELKVLSSDPKWSFSQNLWGSWLRVDIAAIMSQIDKLMASLAKGGLRVPQYSKDNILWTDPDVIFEGKIDSCTLPQPLILSIGPEAGMGLAMNYGVIYFNVSGFVALSEDMLTWAKQKDFHFDHDQDLMSQYIGNRVNTLPDAYNWKLYWGNTTSARRPPYSGGDEIKILHFHGPKLKLAICFYKKLRAFKFPNKVNLEEQWNIICMCGLKSPPETGEGNFGHLATKPYVQTLAYILFQAYQLDKGVFYQDVHNKFLEYSLGI